MGILRTESKMPEDQFSKIPFKSSQLPSVDLTKGPVHYIELLVDICERFDIPEFKEQSAKAIAIVAAKHARQEAERAARHAENEAAKISENSAYNRFLHALKLKNNSVEPLLAWEHGMSLGEKISVLQEFERNASRHGLNLKDDLISFGLHFLASQIAVKLP
jgi:hypothetical protein